MSETETSPPKKEWDLSHDVMTKIIKEIAAGVHPADSRMEYDDEMLAFRKDFESEYKEWKKDHPDGEIAIPTDLPE